MNADKSGMPF